MIVVDRFVIVGKALSCASRIHLLKVVGNDSISVGAAVARTNLGQSTVSYHLAVLCRAGLLERARCGRGHVYRRPAQRLVVRL